MDTINRKDFFDVYRDAYGSLSQSQVDGLDALITSLENDADITDPRQAAYMLATVKHETADTFEPIEEYGKGQGHSYGDPVTVTMDDGTTEQKCFYGRGYVQLTWDYNYKNIGEALGLGTNLWQHPEEVLGATVAYQVMSHGMRHGTFTGKQLDEFINDRECDYYNARTIINGHDQATKIADYAGVFETALSA